MLCTENPQPLHLPVHACGEGAMRACRRAWKKAHMRKKKSSARPQVREKSIARMCLASARTGAYARTSQRTLAQTSVHARAQICPRVDLSPCPDPSSFEAGALS